MPLKLSALDRKLVRNLAAMKGQAIAIGMVIACGVGSFVMALSTLRSLSVTQEHYYERYHFADVFAHVKRAPKSLERLILSMPGVSQVQTRIIADATLDLVGVKEPAVARLVSIPDALPHQVFTAGEPQIPALNSLHLRSGRFPASGRTGEVLVSEAFANIHQTLPGDTLRAVINGRHQRLIVVGIALSPEFIFSIREGDILPDDRHFGVLWMREAELAAAFDMQGAFNDLVLQVRGKPNAEANSPTHTRELLRQLDDLLRPYGGLGSYDKVDQISNKYITNEIEQLRTMAVLTPSIFMGVAAFLLNVVLTRLIATQREEIAALKAFGYSHREVGWHYLKLVLVLSVFGTVLGMGVGAAMGAMLTKMYTKFYHFPVFHFHFDYRVCGLAFLVSAGAASIGAWGAVRQAVSLPPAEAMRPEPPARYQSTFIERMGLQKYFSQPARIVLRNLERRPIKAALTILGIALSLGGTILGNFTEDAINYLLRIEFAQSRQQDMTVTFTEPASARSLNDLRHLPGVQRVQPFRTAATRLRFLNHEQRGFIFALPLPSPADADGGLYRPLHFNGQAAEIPEEGLMISRKLAELLHCRIGDLLDVEVLEGQRARVRLPVVRTVDDLSGLSTYMSLPALHRLLKEGDTVSGAYLAADSRYHQVLYSQLKGTPRVGAVTIKAAMVESFRNTVAENLLRIKMFNVMFATVIAIGVVYNSARIALAERSRELATLRVIGFTRGEISGILLGELAVLTLLAIPLGLVLGYAMCWVISLKMDTEMFRIPLAIDRSTYSFGVSVILAATVFASLIVRRRLDELNLIAVLKTRE